MALLCKATPGIYCEFKHTFLNLFSPCCSHWSNKEGLFYLYISYCFLCYLQLEGDWSKKVEILLQAPSFTVLLRYLKNEMSYNFVRAQAKIINFNGWYFC